MPLQGDKASLINIRSKSWSSWRFASNILQYSTYCSMPSATFWLNPAPNNLYTIGNANSGQSSSTAVSDFSTALKQDIAAAAANLFTVKDFFTGAVDTAKPTSAELFLAYPGTVATLDLIEAIRPVLPPRRPPASPSSHSSPSWPPPRASSSARWPCWPAYFRTRSLMRPTSSKESSAPSRRSSRRCRRPWSPSGRRP
jgi:hypothetical protein